MALPSRIVQWSTILMIASVPVTPMLNTAHDVAILGNDVVVVEPCEIDHVGNTGQYVVTAVRCPDVSTAPRKVVERGYCEVGMQICREAREVALESGLEILFHHGLVSLVLGLNSGPICVAIHKTPPLIRERLPTRRQSPEAQVPESDSDRCRVLSRASGRGRRR